MKYLKQDDYDRFGCIAGKCPSSCCKGWEICIDDETLDKYMDVKGTFESRIKEGIDWNEGTFRQCSGRCTMLNDSDLCDLQLTLGEEMLCYTCGMYPRHMEEFDGVREYTLSLSCPEAANMLVKRADLVSFVETEDDEEEDDPDGYDEFDYMLYSTLLDLREAIGKILRQDDLPIGMRLEIVLAICEEVQKLSDSGEYIDVSCLTGEIAAKEIHKWDYLEAKRDFALLFELERLSSTWEETIDGAWGFFFGSSEDKFERITKSIYEENIIKDEWDKALTNICIQLIYTYLCGAVYDGLIYAKAALAVNFVRWAYMISFYEADSHLDKQIFITTVYRLAKELEHSDENLCALDDWFIV